MASCTISVCLNTYRRAMVFDCLQSIQAQVLPPDATIEIVVSDNDADGSGQAHVERFAAMSTLPVSYRIVPEKNIAVARNDSLARATGEWVAFIDDDEIAEPDWLAQLYTYALEMGADAVLGSVTARYHDDAPAWVVKADPMSKCWGPRGTRMYTGSTCNALVRRARLDGLDGYFNKDFGKAGCDDAELFARLAHSGALILMCPEARVSEDVPPDRAGIEYLRRRSLRVGQSYARIITPYKKPVAVAIFHLQAIARWILLAMAEPVVRLARRDLSLRMRLVRWRNGGKIRELLGMGLIEMY